MTISLVTHTRDSAATLPRLLASTQWVDERIVVDMASRDDTRVVAAEAGCRIIEIDVAPRVDGVRNAALAEAQGEWILVLDSDEYLADDAQQEIWRLIDEQGDDFDGFAIPRFNWIAGQIMRSGGWYPDHQLRLFRRGLVSWSDAHHEAPVLATGPARLCRLEPPGCLHIHHHNYANLQAVIERQLRYALTDRYADDPDAFDFQACVAEAHAAFALRHQPDADGELARALSIVMAWDRLMRGLIQWDRLERKPALGDAYTLPVTTLDPESLRRAYWSLQRGRARSLIRGVTRALRDGLARFGVRRD